MPLFGKSCTEEQIKLLNWSSSSELEENNFTFVSSSCKNDFLDKMDLAYLYSPLPDTQNNNEEVKIQKIFRKY